MIALRNASLALGDKDILDSVDLQIDTSKRIGLVGVNGAGKSTLLKLFAGQLGLDQGAIEVQGGISIGYLPQEILLRSSRSVFDETFAGCGKLAQLRTEAERLEYLLEHEYQDTLVEQYNRVQEQLQLYTPAHVERMAYDILSGLGFSESMMRKSVSQLSLGWGMRVVLAQLMMSGSDFYLFDEPTNHLDLQTKDWFVEYLRSLASGFLLVCHERYVLDALCDATIELELGKAKMYSGNYTKYQEQKAKDLEQLYVQYEQQQREITQKMATIQRFRASASKAQAAQAMLKEVNRIQRITLPPKPKPIKIVLPVAARSARVVCTAKNLGFNFGPVQVFKGVNFVVERGQKIAIVAPNGTGKSTLLGCLSGSLKNYTGTVTLGDHVVLASFAQDQNAVLNQYMTILEYVDLVAPDGNRARIRGLLGSFLFEGEDVNKKIGVLSGGEKNRLCMVTVLLKGANFLLLDEPTNHLDIQSKEVLLKALQAFEGTIVFVSHDHDFVNHLATHVFELRSDGGALFHGNYDMYRSQARLENVSGPSSLTSANSKNSSKGMEQPDERALKALKKEIVALERRITKLEEQVQKTEMLFVEYGYGTPEYAQLVDRLQQQKKDLDDAIHAWEQLQSDYYTLVESV